MLFKTHDGEALSEEPISVSVRLGRAVRTETGRRELASRLATLEPEQRRLIALALPALQALLEEPA